MKKPVEKSIEKPRSCGCGGPVAPASDPETLRRQVSEAYAEALRRAGETGGSCCSSPAGFAARSAGYSDEDRAGLDAAAVSSFGCGNPLAFSHVRAGETVLDLGSGAGFDLLLAARRVGPTGRVIGVDMTDAMIEAARENARRAGFDNVEVRKGVIEELPVDDASVDHVISNCVINLAPDKERVFAEIARVLRPGGRFAVSDIVAEDLPPELRREARAYSACIGGAISEAEYIAGLEAAGLVEVEVGERHVYGLDELRGIVGGDLQAAGHEEDRLHRQLETAVGKVHSARVTGRKP
jgi:SAM-dependent methyltransferase